MDKYLMAAVIYSRVMQLYYHYCHNLVKGTAFHHDHQFFKESYEELTSDYDKFAEYFIAIYGNEEFDTKRINELVTQQLESLEPEKMSAEDMYSSSIGLETQYQNYLTQLNEQSDLGLQNVVQGAYSQSDVRVYKMQQRTKE